MNVINVIGRLGADSELRDSKGGRQYLSMRIATDEFKNGEKSTAWFNVTFVGDRAAKLQEYLKKGRQVSVVGSETIRTYQTNNGETAFSRDIMADRIDFVNSGSGQTQSNDEAVADTGKFERKNETAEMEAATSATQADDLPF